MAQRSAHQVNVVGDPAPNPCRASVQPPGATLRHELLFQWLMVPVAPANHRSPSEVPEMAAPPLQDIPPDHELPFQ